MGTVEVVTVGVGVAAAADVVAVAVEAGLTAGVVEFDESAVKEP